MADDTSAPTPRALFVGLSTPEFNAKVRDLSEAYFNIVDSVPPMGMPGRQSLRGPGVVPYRAVIVAFSFEHDSEYAPAAVIDAVVKSSADSEYYFVFPDDQPQDPLEPFIDKILDGRVPDRSIVSLRNFIAALEVRYAELIEHSSGIASAEAFGEGGEVINDEIIVTFDESLSAEQIKATLTALADYYRACGGVGLPADFESQESQVLEDARV